VPAFSQTVRFQCSDLPPVVGPRLLAALLNLSAETNVLGQSAIHLDVGTGSESEFYWKEFMTTQVHLPVRISLVMTPLDVGTEVQATMTDRLGFVTVQVPHLGNIGRSQGPPWTRAGLCEGVRCPRSHAPERLLATLLEDDPRRVFLPG
jgi:hypothetical protein